MTDHAELHRRMDEAARAAGHRRTVRVAAFVLFASALVVFIAWFAVEVARVH